MPGLTCPRCKKAEHRVVATDHLENQIRRRRECESCGFRFNTFESTESAASRLAEIEKGLAPLVEIVTRRAA